MNVLGTVLVVGGAAFAAFALRGHPSDVHAVLRWAQRGGVLLVLGALAEAATTTAILAGGWAGLTSLTDLRTALWSTIGVAIALRAVGGFIAAFTTSLDTRLVSATGDEHLWDYRSAPGSLVGVALVAASFMFDGHTASEGPRLLHAITNLAHVTAAAVWAGGVAMLALTLHRRRTADKPTRALQLGMRFSTIATFSLIAAGVAGIVLSVVVLDSVTALWSTPWGRLLASKVLVVGVAAIGGGYNHFVVLPGLDENPEHPEIVDRFRRIATLEAIALLAVACITAFLIAASAA